MMRFRHVVFGLVAVLSLAACTQSELDPEQKVKISGRLADPAGAPAPDSEVSLRAEPTGAQVLGGLGAGFATVGLVCAAEPRPAICSDNTRYTGSGRDGAFRFDLVGSQTQDSFGTAREFALTALTAPRDSELSGPATSASFLIQVPDLRLGQLSTWRPRVVIGGSGKARVEWTALPAGLPSPHAYQLVFDNGHGAVVWSQDGGGNASIDARLLEGTGGGVSVVAKTARAGPNTEIHTRYRSPRLPYRASSPVPLSRGASCRFERPQGQREEPGWRRDCPLTDGDFANPGYAYHDAVLDLGRHVPLSLLALRGCRSGGSCVVEFSTDARRWESLATLTGPFASTAPPDAPIVRYLRVRSSSGPLEIGELSAWSGPPVGSLRLVEPERLDAPRTDSAGEDDVPWLWIVLGGGVLVLASGGFGFWLSHRRR